MRVAVKLETTYIREPTVFFKPSVTECRRTGDEK